MPKRHRQFRGRRNHTRQPNDRNDTHQHVDDLGSRRTRIDRGVGLSTVRRNRTTDRDQSCEPHQRQRSLIETEIKPQGLGALTGKGRSQDPLVVDGKTAE